MRGDNLRRGQPDGDRGRSLGGKKRAERNTEILDDSGRTVAQYRAMRQWCDLVARVGRRAASREMARRGTMGWMRVRQEYSRYIGEMRALRNEPEGAV